MIIKIKYSDNNSVIITYDDGSNTQCQLHNREYDQVLKWVSDGNPIEDEVAVEEQVAEDLATLSTKYYDLWNPQDKRIGA